MFSVILWFVEEYIYYSIIIFISSVVSAFFSWREQIANYEKLREMSFFETKVFVYRGVSGFFSRDQVQLEIKEGIKEKRVEISSLNLVPGDIIEIPE